jgi:hypothetical protein
MECSGRKQSCKGIYCARRGRVPEIRFYIRPKEDDLFAMEAQLLFGLCLLSSQAWEAFDIRELGSDVMWSSAVAERGA